MWFMIKTQHSWTQGPHHVLLQLRYVREMSPSVQALIGKYLKSSAWNAHLEAILLSGTESVGTITQRRHKAQIQAQPCDTESKCKLHSRHD